MKSLVIIPTYNEKDNIAKLVPDVLQQNENIDILIVDDNSPDGTGKVADKLALDNPRVSVMHRPGKMGLGTAYIQGFNYALGKNYDYIFSMDADFSHDPKYLPDFLEKIKDGDLVTGSRYIHGISVVNWGLKRLFMSKMAGVYVRFVTGLPCTDPTSGFMCYKREVLQKIPLDKISSNGYAFLFEMKYRAFRLGFNLSEVPIVFVDRSFGESKLGKDTIREALFMVWKLKLGLYKK